MRCLAVVWAMPGALSLPILGPLATWWARLALPGLRSRLGWTRKLVPRGLGVARGAGFFQQREAATGLGCQLGSPAALPPLALSLLLAVLGRMGAKALVALVALGRSRLAFALRRLLAALAIVPVLADLDAPAVVGVVARSVLLGLILTGVLVGSPLSLRALPSSAGVRRQAGLGRRAAAAPREPEGGVRDHLAVPEGVFLHRLGEHRIPRVGRREAVLRIRDEAPPDPLELLAAHANVRLVKSQHSRPKRLWRALTCSQ